jgi:hypothetical protein
MGFLVADTILRVSHSGTPFSVDFDENALDGCSINRLELPDRTNNQNVTRSSYIVEQKVYAVH